MISRTRSSLSTAAVLTLLGACGSPTWYAHPCGNGDPVGISCEDGDYTYDDPSTDLCEDLAVADGDPCDEVDRQCVVAQGFSCTSMPDGGHSSEAFLTCRSQPYSEDDALCPESSRSVKRDIHYVDAPEREALAQQVLDVKLARYHYTDPERPGRKLGYILEDSPEAAFSGQGRVDLYAYLSAIVALNQQQQTELDALKAEVARLRAREAAAQ